MMFLTVEVFLEVLEMQKCINKAFVWLNWTWLWSETHRKVSELTCCFLYLCLLLPPWQQVTAWCSPPSLCSGLFWTGSTACVLPPGNGKHHWGFLNLQDSSDKILKFTVTVIPWMTEEPKGCWWFYGKRRDNEAGRRSDSSICILLQVELLHP